MHGMLGGVHEVIELNHDGMFGLLCADGTLRYFPPSVMAVQETVQEDDLFAAPSVQILQQPVDPPTPQQGEAHCAAVVELLSEPVTTSVPPSGLSIECWSIVDEGGLARIERAVAHFVGLLEAEGVALPDNIHLVAPCRETQHSACFVYRFGTRRLHLSTRATDDGRLLLVVRCGGGFMDFLHFARRHGGLEQLRLRRILGAGGAGTVRVASILSQGRVQVKATQPARKSTTAPLTACDGGERRRGGG